MNFDALNRGLGGFAYLVSAAYSSAIAIEVHQNAVNSSDLAVNFHLWATGMDRLRRAEVPPAA